MRQTNLTETSAIVGDTDAHADTIHVALISATDAHETIEIPGHHVWVSGGCRGHGDAC
jgi:hypothetical protein